MITNEQQEKVQGWFSGRLPKEWTAEPAKVTVDREEITVVLTIDDVTGGESEVEQAEARAGRARAFREETRDARIKIAREAEHRYERKVSWGVQVGQGESAHSELWTHVSAPVMTRLRQPNRLVLDTLVEAGVARSRSEALAWCVRLVGQHEEDWLAELREAMASVADVRDKGPAA
jgi:post-segregation antitoxin (ccd killing protein)